MIVGVVEEVLVIDLARPPILINTDPATEVEMVTSKTLATLAVETETVTIAEDLEHLLILTATSLAKRLNLQSRG